MAPVLTKARSLLFDDDDDGAYIAPSVRRLAFSSCGGTRDGWAYSLCIACRFAIENSGKKKIDMSLRMRKYEI
jgi:hypothetical protein